MVSRFQMGLFAMMVLVVGLHAGEGWIQVKAAPGIKIFLDGDFKGSTNTAHGGLILEKVKEGSRILKAVKDNFAPQSQVTRVKAGEVTLITLKPFVPSVRISQEGEEKVNNVKAMVGKLIIRSIPVECTIKIAKLDIESTKTKQKWQAEKVPVGRYELVAEGLNKKIEHVILITNEQTTDLMLDFLNKKVVDNTKAKPQLNLDVLDKKTPLTYPARLAQRTEAGRRNAVGKYGGSRGGQNAVSRAMRWLAKVQNQNGSWGAPIQKVLSPQPGHPAHTGLALLVFLAHGETPLSEKYGKTVLEAMKWLAEYGSQEGLKRIVKKKPGSYTHAIATYAIAEAYAMTQSPLMKAAMENCVDALIDGQMKNGGFGYAYTSGPRWDLSVAGWNMQALTAAQTAGSTHEKLKDSIRKSIHFCKTAYGGEGGFGYASKPGSHHNMGGVGTASMQMLGAIDDHRVREGCGRIGTVRLKSYKEVMADPTKWKTVGSHCLYGWYYDTQAIFNSQNVDKARWKAWRTAFETVLIRSQNAEGYWETSSHGTGPTTSGRVLSTCWAALQLQVYYRYLPTFDKGRAHKKASSTTKEE